MAQVLFLEEFTKSTRTKDYSLWLDGTVRVTQEVQLTRQLASHSTLSDNKETLRSNWNSCVKNPKPDEKSNTYK